MQTTSGKSTSEGQEFIEASRIFFSDFMAKMRQCVEDMPEPDLWWRPNEESNSAGNLILHLCGNMKQWILNSMSDARYDRDRDAEFSERGPLPKDQLLSAIDRTVFEVDKVLGRLQPSTLLQRFPVQVYSVSRLHAIYHVVEHFSYHLGQILYIYKLRTGKDPGFYRHLASR